MRLLLLLLLLLRVVRQMMRVPMPSMHRPHCHLLARHKVTWQRRATCYSTASLVVHLRRQGSTRLLLLHLLLLLRDALLHRRYSPLCVGRAGRARRWYACELSWSSSRRSYACCRLSLRLCLRCRYCCRRHLR